MSMHRVIVVSSVPKGVFGEGVMVEDAGEFYPGQHACIDPDAETIDGRPQFRLWEGDADGERSTLYLIRENEYLGKKHTDPYDAGSRFFYYIPLPGNEVQVRLSDVAGTGTAGTERPGLGEKLILESGTGNVIKTTGSPESEPYEAIEVLPEPISEATLLLVRCTGH